MEIQKHLQSLKSLYRILQTSAIDMDDGARLLLKNLLDSARDNLLLSTSTIITTTPSMSSNSYMHNSRKLEEQSSFRKKRCRVCQQSKDESSTDFSNQVSNSIKLIDSTVLSLQLSSDISNPIKLQSLQEEEEAAGVTNSPSFLIPGHRNESPSYHYVHGLRIPSIWGNHGTITADTSHKTFTNHLLALPDKNVGMLAKRRPSMQSQLDCASTTHSHNQNVMKPMLLNYESFGKKPYGRQQQKMKVPYRQESDVSSSFSLQGSDEQSAVSSPTSSYSSRSQADTETSDVTPETSPEESTSNSSVNSSESYRNTDGSSRKMHRANPDKATGRLRKLKNKLQLIFHHHHHHHHHHNNHREKSETNNAKDLKSSMWKHLGTMFHPKDKERMYEKQAVRKVKTLPVSKKQAGQFQALVKGMTRHVKQSKKSKMPKGRMRSHHDNKQWLQLFHGRRGRGVKLPNGGRIRLQVKGKKPQLRSPKILK